MYEFFAVAGPAAFLLGLVLLAAERSYHLYIEEQADLAHDRLGIAKRLHADALSILEEATRITGPKVDGPSALSRLISERFDLNPQLAGEIANTAVWHFESPLAVGAVDPAKRHPWQEGAR